eukprot:TRINITY_DN19841_c0_g1_i3.p1 TRINITY_DN19841_c0_g1~~TRINITY_DN19841_c0_g1_i3.p1  ORF type:complete len:100 (+),score=19.01 TRINITY_DN19841_c0_g1_i3:506-805(+)
MSAPQEQQHAGDGYGLGTHGVGSEVCVAHPPFTEYGSSGATRSWHLPPMLHHMYLSLIHISEPTRLLSISYAVFCLKKKKKKTRQTTHINNNINDKKKP